MDIVMKRSPGGRERPQEKDFVERRVVRVLPTSDAIRKYLKHQPSKVGFLKEGSVEWPLDSFTRNRLRDGDITIEPAKPKEVEHKKPTTRPATSGATHGANQEVSRTARPANEPQS